MNLALEYKGQTHAQARCQECRWRTSGNQVTRDAARKHAKETGHRVTVKKTMTYHINPS